MDSSEGPGFNQFDPVLTATRGLSRRFGLAGGLAIFGILLVVEGDEIIKALGTQEPVAGANEIVTLPSGLKYTESLVGRAGDAVSHAPRDRKLMVALAEVRCAWDGRVRGFEHRALSLTQRGPALEARLRCLTPAGASAWREEGVRLSAERYWQLRMTHPNAATRGACGLWEAAVRAASESSLAGGGIDKASLKVVVEAAASNAEEQIRRCVLAPSRSLIWDSSELRGVAGAMHSASAWIDESSDACPLVGPTQANQLFGAIQELHLCVEACLADIIEARCRLRDLLGWIRSTSSQVKARGTAPDSALREHARKRRGGRIS